MSWLTIFLIWYSIGIITFCIYIILIYIIQDLEDNTMFTYLLVGFITGFGGILATILLIYLLLDKEREFLSDLKNSTKTWKMNIFKTKCIIIDLNLPLKFKRYKFNKHLKYDLFLFTITLLDRSITEVISSIKNTQVLFTKDDIGPLYRAFMAGRFDEEQGLTEINKILMDKNNII